MGGAGEQAGLPALAITGFGRYQVVLLVVCFVWEIGSHLVILFVSISMPGIRAEARSQSILHFWSRLLVVICAF